MKKRKLPAILCSAVLTASLALCSVPAAAETETPVPSQNLDLRSISSFKDLLSLADRFVSPFALYEGEKQYCYLVYFEAEASNINNISGNLTFPSNLNVVECTPSNGLIDNDEANIISFKRQQQLTDGRKNAQISSNVFTPLAVGSEIMEYRLQGKTSIQSLDNILVSCSSGIRIRKIFMADANNDGTVDSSDALYIMQASNGKVTLSGDAAIAADVDRDGSVTAADSLLALQYSTGKATSLWSHGYLSKQENPNITSGKIYRLRSTDDGLNLKTALSGGYGTVADYERTSDDFKYKFTHLGNGLYKITQKGDDTKALTASGAVSLSAYTGADSQKWYVNGSGDNFYLVPKSKQDTFLTTRGASMPKLEYNTYGGSWRIYGAEVTIYNYYDTGMLTRWNLTESQMETAINAYVDEAIDFYKDYGVDIKRGPTVHVESEADKCTGASTNSQLNAKCEHYASSNVNHKNNKYLYRAFFQENCNDLSASDPFIPIFWTGHFTWEQTVAPEEVSSENRVTNGGFASSFFQKANGVIILNNGNYGEVPQTPFSSVQRIRFTVFHELGHAFCGLPDSYCKNNLSEEPCDNINCYFHFKDTGRAKNCIMTEDIMTSTSKEYYLCDVCDAEAKQKIPSLW